MKLLLNIRGLILASLVLLVSCVSNTRDVVHPDELRDYGPSHGERLEWFYCGSDTLHHHFLTRIADVTLVRLVKVSELKLARTWAVGSYQLLRVYPERDFELGSQSKIWHYHP